MRVEFPLGPKTPDAQMTVRAYVKCADQAEKQFCHVVNFAETAGTNVYFPTAVIDSRPPGLFTAVFICAFIGPVLLAAFLVYERGVLAKKAN